MCCNTKPTIKVDNKSKYVKPIVKVSSSAQAMMEKCG